MPATVAPSQIFSSRAQRPRVLYWCLVRRSEFIVLLPLSPLFPACSTLPLWGLPSILKSGLVSSGFPGISLFLSDTSRTSFPLVIAPSCATSSSSLALSSPPVSALAFSVIEESLVSGVPLSLLLRFRHVSPLVLLLCLTWF